MGVTKMGNILPRAALAFYGSVCYHYTSADYYTRPLEFKSVNAYNYIQARALHIHTQGMFNNHTAHSLYRIMVMAKSAMDEMKMGNIVHRVEFEPISLAFWASVL